MHLFFSLYIYIYIYVYISKKNKELKKKCRALQFGGFGMSIYFYGPVEEDQSEVIQSLTFSFLG
jgi:hypothetical protein